MARMKRHWDVGRMAEAISRPGIDPRTWVSMARVVEDEEGIRWEEPFGWVVDVFFQGGDLNQAGPHPCRVADVLGGSSRGKFAPVSAGCSCIVLVPEGQVNVSPIIIGYTHNSSDCPVPSEVNGTTITEQYAKATELTVSPDAYDASYEGSWRLSNTAMTLLVDGTYNLQAESIEWLDASQAFVRGDDLIEQLNLLATALSTLPSAFLPQPAPGGPAAITAFTQAVTAFQSALSGTLSTKISGE